MYFNKLSLISLYARAGNGRKRLIGNLNCFFFLLSILDILNVEENFNRVWSEINNVLKDHVTEMHLKFELQFSVMSREIRKRDEIIANLQSKIRNIELKTSSPRRKSEHTPDKLSKLWVDTDLKSENHASSSSSAELLFMVFISVNFIKRSRN